MASATVVALPRLENSPPFLPHSKGPDNRARLPLSPQLIRKWQEDGVAVDGKTLLTHDLTLLTAGCSVAVKSKIQRAVQALRGEPQVRGADCSAAG